MVEKVYWIDPYKKELDAKVMATLSNGIELDKTIFYPTGGGQPCDTGVVVANGEEYKVVDVKKLEGSIVHILDKVPKFYDGDAIHCKIDWDKRYAYMKYHTALHILDGILENEDTGKEFKFEGSGMITGGQIYTNKARIDFDMQGFSREIASKLINSAQAFIDESHEVHAKLLTREEAENIPNLARTEPGKELLNKLTEIRVVEISGLDVQLDGGTHVANTKEIGKLRLTNYESKGSRRKRIEIKID